MSFWTPFVLQIVRRLVRMPRGMCRIPHVAGADDRQIDPVSGLADGAPGLVGNALVLDGACGIRLPYHQDNLGTSFTISLWYWQLTNDTRQCVYQTRDNYDITYEAQAGANANFVNFIGQEGAGILTTGLKEWIRSN